MNGLIKHTGILLMLSLPLIAGSPGAAQSPEAGQRGQSLFEGHCASCHGITGEGNGLDANGLSPAPTNFRSPGVMDALSDNDLEQVILGGKPDTAMQGYGTVLNSEDVVALIAYLRSFSAAP